MVDVDDDHLRGGPRRRKDRAIKVASLARIPIRWSHLIDENTRQFMNVEHVLVGKVGPLFRNMLYSTQIESRPRSVSAHVG
jgi:hypothetical protein